VDVDQEPVREPEPAAQPPYGTDRTPDLSAQIGSLVRLLARQEAREHLHRLSQPDAEDTTDEP
jgi:hypothetical protein